ncbi:hypothetical protein Rhopal_006155-T1 [Rhodotorula paludigena]|uniref:Protein kinase domain-containing protein n=1 Tax=Rhodotorula paludigena TaxID=86838 RepID=A0AAV5GKG9_9BASI|nr:hypothetical protein Rhopal_006155-T1 [Rhodotorula paludigena]
MGFAPLPTCYDTLSPLFHAQYALVEEIGVGGSGFVLKVQRRSNGEFFAAKVIAKDRVSRQTLVRTRSWGSVPPGFELDEQDALVVPAEAYVLRKMRHPGVCGFIDLFADDRFFYLILEYHGASVQASNPPKPMLPPSPPISPLSACVPLAPTASGEGSALPSPALPTFAGTPASLLPAASPLTPTNPPPPPMMRRTSSDLFDWVERQRHFSEGIARYIFYQLVNTACDLAQMGVLHRDWKDENVCIDERLRVKLVDFGSVVIFDPAGPAPIQYEKRFYGTCTYASPEVFGGGAYAMLPAEVWSLGVLLHVLLTGENPFLSPADAIAGKRIQTKVVLSATAQDLLDRCLAVRLDERIQLEDMRHHPWVSGQWAV